MTQPQHTDLQRLIPPGPQPGFRSAEQGGWVFGALVLVALAYAAVGSWFACGGHVATLRLGDLLRAGLVVVFGLSSD
jgi:hypothetical protein